MSSRLATREALFDVMEQIAEERIAARPIVQKLLSRGDEMWDEEIPESWRTAGFVQELTAAAAGILESDPSRSLSFAQWALAVASSIPRQTYPSPVQAFVEGRAWKEIATAHRYLDKYEPALRAFDAAHRAFWHESALIHEATRAQFGRAVVLMLRRQDNDALELIEQTAQMFRGFEDQRYGVECEAVKAIIFWHRGHVKEALAINLELLANFRDTDDLHTLGALYNNIGHLQAIFGNLGEAASALQHGREIFSALDMPAEVDRADWGLAKILLSSGDFARALPTLYRLRKAYLERRMPADAGLIALYIVDALVATGRREDGLQLTEDVLKEFVTANLNQHAITALAYLRDLLPRANRPRQAVNRVRSYVERLRTDPAPLFLPLDPNRQ